MANGPDGGGRDGCLLALLLPVGGGMDGGRGACLLALVGGGRGGLLSIVGAVAWNGLPAVIIAVGRYIGDAVAASMMDGAVAMCSVYFEAMTSNGAEKMQSLLSCDSLITPEILFHTNAGLLAINSASKRRRRCSLLSPSSSSFAAFGLGRGKSPTFGCLDSRCQIN